MHRTPTFTTCTHEYATQNDWLEVIVSDQQNRNKTIKKKKDKKMCTHRTLPPQNWHSSPCQPSGQTQVPFMHTPPFIQLLCDKLVVHFPIVTSMLTNKTVLMMMMNIIQFHVIRTHFRRHFIVFAGRNIWLEPINILNLDTFLFCQCLVGVMIIHNIYFLILFFFSAVVCTNQIVVYFTCLRIFFFLRDLAQCVCVFYIFFFFSLLRRSSLHWLHTLCLRQFSVIFSHQYQRTHAHTNTYRRKKQKIM